jgi:hypothetical protein
MVVAVVSQACKLKLGITFYGRSSFPGLRFLCCKMLVRV